YACCLYPFPCGRGVCIHDKRVEIRVAGSSDGESDSSEPIRAALTDSCFKAEIWEISLPLLFADE
ncbi:hypothetical protein, partial [Parabacteroides johnsonii]|uniref:hypothetical protein n=1 Tax=Parabacteroides johnsonii TaxID=387661 RepID=UPI00242B9E54